MNASSYGSRKSRWMAEAKRRPDPASTALAVHAIHRIRTAILYPTFGRSRASGKPSRPSLDEARGETPQRPSASPLLHSVAGDSGGGGLLVDYGQRSVCEERPVLGGAPPARPAWLPWLVLAAGYAGVAWIRL